MLKKVAIVSEGVCAEDPHGADRQVSLFPADARKLVDAGCQVSIEDGAGRRMGFSNQEYARFGVQVEPRESVYRGKDLVVKIKGPTNEAIREMDPGSTLFCMAHLPMYPDRKAALEEQRVSVVAMEAVSEGKFRLDSKELAPNLFAKQVFDSYLKSRPAAERHVVVVGYSEATDGMIRYLGRKQLASLLVVPASGGTDWVSAARKGTVVVSDVVGNPDSLRTFVNASAQEGIVTVDFSKFSKPNERRLPLEDLFPDGKLPQFGKRGIQCLHETGRAGAQFGIEVLDSDPRNTWSQKDIALVLGYGNVAMGAIDQCVRQGQAVFVLGRHNTQGGRIERWLSRSKLVINGAFIPDELAGIEFVVSNQHVDRVMRPGTVLIDLIGGSPTDRSPVEPVDTCTFLGAPMFERNGVRIASVFAWPNYYRTFETNGRYSSQIANVLVQPEGLLTGLRNTTQGIRKAIVLGPFDGPRETGSLF